MNTVSPTPPEARAIGPLLFSLSLAFYYWSAFAGGNTGMTLVRQLTGQQMQLAAQWISRESIYSVFNFW